MQLNYFYKVQMLLQKSIFRQKIFEKDTQVYN